MDQYVINTVTPIIIPVLKWFIYVRDTLCPPPKLEYDEDEIIDLMDAEIIMRDSSRIKIDSQNLATICHGIHATELLKQYHKNIDEVDGIYLEFIHKGDFITKEFSKDHFIVAN